MVIRLIGKSEIGSCQPIINELGIKQRKAINIPLRIALRLSCDVPMKKPVTTHIVNADRFAFQGNF